MMEGLLGGMLKNWGEHVREMSEQRDSSVTPVGGVRIQVHKKGCK